MCVWRGGGRWGGGKGQGEEWSYHHNGQSNGPFPGPSNDQSCGRKVNIYIIRNHSI